MLKRFRDSIFILSITLILIVALDISLKFTPNKFWAWEKYSHHYCDDRYRLNFLCDSLPDSIAHFPLLYISLRNWLTITPPNPIPIDDFDNSEGALTQKFSSALTQRTDTFSGAPLEGMPQAHYYYSPKGYRIPSKRYFRESKRHFLAVFGGSFAHGDHLSYKEAMPYQLAKHHQGLNEYNYGAQGKGLKEPLLATMDQEFLQHILEDSGIFLYVYTVMANDRIYPSIHLATQTFHHFLDVDKNDQVIYRGYNYQAFPGLPTLLAFIQQSGIAHLLGLTNAVWPKVNTERHICVFANELKKRLTRAKPKSEFAVLIYEMSGDHFYDCLEKSGIKTITPFFDHVENRVPNTYLPDGHPDAKAHKNIGLFAKDTIAELLQSLETKKHP